MDATENTVAGTAGRESTVDAADALRSFHIVVAANRSMGIGRGGRLPWKLAGDMAHFRTLTQTCRAAGKRNAVIMGRRTWESIPAKFRPLAGRLNVVLTRQAVSPQGASPGGNLDTPGQHRPEGGYGASTLHLPKGVLAFHSLEDALSALAKEPHASTVDFVFVIGGEQVYDQAVRSAYCDAIHQTRVEQSEEAERGCDTFFPEVMREQFRVWTAAPFARDAPAGERYAFMVLTPAGREAPVAMPPAVACQHEEYQVGDGSLSSNALSSASSVRSRQSDRCPFGSWAWVLGDAIEWREGIVQWPVTAFLLFTFPLC